MIQPEALAAVIKEALPDAQVDVTDRTGALDHYTIRVVSGQFRDVNLMDRHRMVMNALQPLMADGRLHAAEIKTELPA